MVVTNYMVVQEKCPSTLIFSPNFPSLSRVRGNFEYPGAVPIHNPLSERGSEDSPPARQETIISP